MGTEVNQQFPENRWTISERIDQLKNVTKLQGKLFVNNNVLINYIFFY